jgi:hypothetical protein
VYGRDAAPTDRDLARLADLEARDARIASESVHDPADLRSPEPTPSAPAAPSLTAVEDRPRTPRRWIAIAVATVGVVAAGGFASGFAAGVLALREPPPPAALTPPASSVPQDLLDDYARIEQTWQWDPGSLRVGAIADGAVIWAGSLADATEVCLVVDQPPVASIMCNPAGFYPSQFRWDGASQPAPGIYDFVLQQTGEVTLAPR